MKISLLFLLLVITWCLIDDSEGGWRRRRRRFRIRIRVRRILKPICNSVCSIDCRQVCGYFVCAPACGKKCRKICGRKRSEVSTFPYHSSYHHRHWVYITSLQSPDISISEVLRFLVTSLLGTRTETDILIWRSFLLLPTSLLKMEKLHWPSKPQTLMVCQHIIN